MKLSRASSYAIHAVVYLATRKSDVLVGSQEIAQLLGITENRLVRILKSLVAARILWSLRGPGGGYRLVRPASRISLLDIIEGVDGPARSAAASLAGIGQEMVEHRLEVICEQVAEWTRNVLSKIMIADLLEKSDRSFRAVLPLQRPDEERQLLPPEVAEGLERIRKLMAARDSGLQP
jgi:Rrf2 family protein